MYLKLNRSSSTWQSVSHWLFVVQRGINIWNEAQRGTWVKSTVLNQHLLLLQCLTRSQVTYFTVNEKWAVFLFRKPHEISFNWRDLIKLVGAWCINIWEWVIYLKSQLPEAWGDLQWCKCLKKSCLYTVQHFSLAVQNTKLFLFPCYIFIGRNGNLLVNIKPCTCSIYLSQKWCVRWC